MTAAAPTRILLNVNLFLTILGFILYIAAFASNNWVVDDSSNYGLWKKCERNNVTGDEICTTIDVSDMKDYFETTRAFATLGLIAFFMCVVTVIIDESEEDKGMKRTCYRYIHCLCILITVFLSILTLSILGGDYEEDEVFQNPSLDWCFLLVVAVTVIHFFNFLLRFKYINDAHNTSYSGECCLSRHPARTKPERKAPHDPESQFSRGSANGRSSLPPATIRVDSERVVMGEEGAGSKLPPLPGGRRNSRSSDSGMDSRDMSRDSTLDEPALGLASGPLPLSAEMLRRHDRRWHSKKRLEDRRHRRPAFSSTTSLSSTDSQSSAELAPRVHTPTNLKRVHYNIPKEPLAHSGDGAHSAPQPASYEDVLAAGKDGEACTVAPIISFPIKLQGVELSRASTNSRATATIDNIKLTSAAVRKWQRAARRLSRQSLGEAAEVAEVVEAGKDKNKKKKKSKEKKKKKKEKKGEREEKLKDDEKVVEASGLKEQKHKTVGFKDLQEDRFGYQGRILLQDAAGFEGSTLQEQTGVQRRTDESGGARQKKQKRVEFVKGKEDVLETTGHNEDVTVIKPQSKKSKPSKQKKKKSG